MLAIILGILKFIGLLLLGILGLVLVLILLVLLVPVRYRACGSYYGGLKGSASVSWLLHILSCQVRYDGETDMCIRVFGIRIGRKQKSDSDADSMGGRMLSDADKTKTGESLSGTVNEEQQKTPPDSTEKPDLSQESLPQKKQKTRNAQRAQKTQKTRKKRESRRKFPFGNPVEKIRVTFHRICDRLKVLSEKKDQILAFINQEDNRRTFRLLKKQAGALFKHILPTKIKGRIRFGFDDPYTTGQILTWVSPFYGLYAKKLQLIPEFEEPVLEGEVDLRGRIRIGTLIAVAVRIYMDKNFRTLLKKWREA